ncbi:high-affinity branched-chain amino acid ABC transporter permease LivM [Telmatospirillum siberiense]|uniref:Branched-chain amino acid ABC transporter permease n=1 Tax=Telmatospirillum siberiense TaxID=382514 RepID=A0A2N3PP71_9PROT|nr:high-affinity branched-chain amino acid ABC transporter permease LivM [Telmatospirillum siberiense]PKU22205.1 branched-chain amino acid ABC transporter permease [Telmatospirillum siberiense]
MATTSSAPLPPKRNDGPAWMPSLLKDAFAAGVLAALLALPMLGFRLVDSAQGLSLDYRFSWVGIAFAAVFAGRLAISLARNAWDGRRRPMRERGTEESHGLRLRKLAGWLMVAAALLLPWTPIADRNLIDKATLLLIYVMLGWGLNVVVGLAGLLDLGYVAFYAVGAYSYALLSQNFGLSFWLCLPLAGAFAATFGMLLGFPVLRLRGDYLAIVTLGFGEIVRVVLLNWQVVTGGPNGLSGIQRPSFFGLPFLAAVPGKTTFHEFFGLPFSPDHRILFLYYLILILALATNLFTLRIRRLPIGRAWEALREDETACRSLGINPTKTKLSAFATGAMFAGFAGSFFATRQGFISPESFTFLESAIILAIVVLGGLGSQIGIVLSAFLLVGLPEWFRELQQYRMLAFGGAMVLIMLWRPRGLLSSREPTVRLGKTPKAPEPMPAGEGATP